MIRGLYTSGWSMMANSKKMDIVSNNLANVNTTAYKKDTMITEGFPEVLAKRVHDSRSITNPSGDVGNMSLSSDGGEIFTYYTQGQVAKTDGKYDFAIKDDGKSFFTIGVPDGNGNVKNYYTRDGSFTVNSNRQLVTQEGYTVMGVNGPITLEGDNFSVQDDGTVVQNGKEVDKLLMAKFTDTKTLRKFGSNLVETTAQSREEDFNGTITQGFLEQSNVNVVKEMVDMITAMRSYEANQKILQAEDGTLDKVVNEVGAVRA